MYTFMTALTRFFITHFLWAVRVLEIISSV